MANSEIDNKMKVRILVEILFKERKNYNADENDKKSDRDMINEIKSIIEKEVKRNEVQENDIK